MVNSSQPLSDQLETLFANRTLDEIESALMEFSRRRSQRLVNTVRNHQQNIESEIRADQAPKKVPPSKKKISPKESLSRKTQQLRKSSRRVNAEIAQFADDIGARQALLSSPDIIRFSQTIDLPISGKKVERAILSRKIAETLERRDPSVALDLIELGRRMGNEQSSLQRWADVIVRKRSDNI